MRAYLVAGLAFGDEGKGATVDALVRHTGAKLVVRYNGGAQAAHNVVTPEGKHHTFSQFGSGTFVPGTKTYLSQYMIINPYSMLVEAAHLLVKEVGDALSRTYVDKRALIATRFQQALNRLTELSRGDERHGSTGMGIGQTRSDHFEYGDQVLFAGDLVDKRIVKEKLEFIKSECLRRALHLPIDDKTISKDTLREMEMLSWPIGEGYVNGLVDWAKKIHLVNNAREIVTNESDVIFEGAQGILLDELYGFHPHTTWTDITYQNAQRVLEEALWTDAVLKIGVLRSYYTRHGAGPFPSEDPDQIYPEHHNGWEKYPGDFRQGMFDMPLALYAKQCIGHIDSIALNHLDIVQDKAGRIKFSKNVSVNFDHSDFIEIVESHIAPVSIQGYGPTYDQRLIDTEILKYAQVDYAGRALGVRKVEAGS